MKYRYWKKFHGKIIHNGKQSNITLNSHFRPMGMHLDYDWNNIMTDLCNEGILHKFNSNIMVIDANKLVHFWCEKLSDNHLYLLDEESRKWVEPKLELLGRSFISQDFEGV